MVHKLLHSVIYMKTMLKEKHNRLKKYNSVSTDVKLYWGDENKWKVVCLKKLNLILFLYLQIGKSRSDGYTNHA